MSHFFECLSDWDSFTGVDEHCPDFGLCGGCHDGFNDLCDAEDRAVVGRMFFVVGEEEVSSRPAAGLGNAEI